MICFLMVSQRVDIDSVCFSAFLNFFLFFLDLQMTFYRIKDFMNQCMHYVLYLISPQLCYAFSVGHEDLFRVFAAGGLFGPVVDLVHVVDCLGGYRRSALVCAEKWV